MKYWLTLTGSLLLLQLNAQEANLKFNNEELSAKTTSAKLKPAGNFRTADGIILLKAKIDDREGVFILDTGAPGLYLNEAPKKDPPIKGYGVNGTIPIGSGGNKDFSVLDYTIKNVPSFTLNISHLERATGRKLAGLAGFELFRGKCIFIDYEKSLANVLSSQKRRKLLKTFPPTYILPFQLQHHIPVIKVKIGVSLYRMGIDTGAEISLIDEKTSENLRPGYTPGKAYMIKGLSRHFTPGISIRINSLRAHDRTVQNLEFLPVDFTNLNHADTGLELQGLLGISFFKCRQFAIDYKRFRIYIWE